MGKTLLITGATGYLGSHLVRRFVADGHVVAIVKREMSSLARIADLLDRLQMFDVEHTHKSFAALGRVDAVIHTATNYGRHGEQVTSVFEANTAFPLRLLEVAERHGAKAFINTDTVLDPVLNAYALSKHHFKEWGRLTCDGRIRFINLRLEYMFGAGDDPAKFATYVIRACLDNAHELKLTKGEQKRDFIFIDDVVNAFAIILENLPALERGFDEFDVGTGKAVSVREFVETIHAITHSKTKLKFGALPYRKNETMFYQADISKLSDLGWGCKHGLMSGLTETIDFERNLVSKI